MRKRRICTYRAKSSKADVGWNWNGKIVLKGSAERSENWISSRDSGQQVSCVGPLDINGWRCSW